jgi:hypothetical protein
LGFGGITGISFQFGRTSTRLPPHLLQIMRDFDFVGVVVAAEYRVVATSRIEA